MTCTRCSSDTCLLIPKLEHALTLLEFSHQTISVDPSGGIHKGERLDRSWMVRDGVQMAISDCRDGDCEAAARRMLSMAKRIRMMKYKIELPVEFGKAMLDIGDWLRGKTQTRPEIYQ